MSLDLNLICQCPYLPFLEGESWGKGQTPLKPWLICMAWPRLPGWEASLLCSYQLQKPGPVLGHPTSIREPQISINVSWEDPERE